MTRKECKKIIDVHRNNWPKCWSIKFITLFIIHDRVAVESIVAKRNIAPVESLITRKDTLNFLNNQFTSLELTLHHYMQRRERVAMFAIQSINGMRLQLSQSQWRVLKLSHDSVPRTEASHKLYIISRSLFFIKVKRSRPCSIAQYY